MIKFSEGFMDQIRPYIPHLLGGAGVGALGNLLLGDSETPWYQRMISGGLGGAALGGAAGYGMDRFGPQIKEWWNGQQQQQQQQQPAPTSTDGRAAPIRETAPEAPNTPPTVMPREPAVASAGLGEKPMPARPAPAAAVPTANPMMAGGDPAQAAAAAAQNQVPAATRPPATDTVGRFANTR